MKRHEMHKTDIRLAPPVLAEIDQVARNGGGDRSSIVRKSVRKYARLYRAGKVQSLARRKYRQGMTSEKVAVKLEQEQVAFLDELVPAWGCTRSQVVRLIVRWRLAQEPKSLRTCDIPRPKLTLDNGDFVFKQQTSS